MPKQVELSNAALVFTDAATGQGYIRKLNEFEVKLVAAQLTAIDNGELKARPVHPVEIRLVTDEDILLANAIKAVVHAPKDGL